MRDANVRRIGQRVRAALSARRGRRRLLGLAVLLFAALAFWRSLPEPLFDAPRAVALYDRDGALLGARIAADGQWRFATPRALPDKLARAIIAFEDRRFARHPGVDPLALGRAAWLDLKHRRIVSGGSTLTMQVARLALGSRERSLAAKLSEMALALRIELSYSKDEILALYGAHAPFGGNVVGMEAAAWRYFGCAPEHLSWAEAATLAVLPNSPALIHPGKGRARLLAKRDALLARLQAQGQLDPMQLRLALAEPLPDRPQPLPRLAPHLLDTLAAREPQVHRFATTLDAALQRAVTDAVQARAAANAAQGVHNAAALVIDNRTMQPRAYVGNAADPAQAGARERGDAVDIVQRPRSTGSLLKPFLYALALQDGLIQPGALLPDVPMHFTGFTPENFDRGFRGAVRAREALAQSLNVPAVYLLREYGLARFYDGLKRAGMTTLHRTPDGYGLTLILGGAEGTLWEMAQLYANLARIAESGARRGQLRQAALTPFDAPPAEGAPVEIGAGAAYLTLDMLQDVSRPELEAYWKSFSSSRRLAWKTGTSYGLRDGWAIGVTPRHTVAVWVGNADGEGRAGLTGAGMAAPLLFDIVHRLDDREWFREPLLELRRVAVCREDGYLPAQDCATETAVVPADGHFARPSPHHQRVQLDDAGRRVHSRCHPVSAMRPRSWFVLPPVQAYYYGMRNAAYRQLPPLRADCRARVEAEEPRAPFDIVYPDAQTAIYIPTDLGRQRGRVVLEAVHRDPQAVLYWHVDDDYVGETARFHQLAIDLAPGPHRLTLVDRSGHRQQRRFEVLGREDAG